MNSSLRNAALAAGTLALFTSASQAATVDIGWTAAGETDGALASWTAATNTTGGTRIWNGGTGGTKASGATNFANVNDWVNSPAYAFNGTSWQTGVGGAVTSANSSWEMVFSPGDFTGNHMLFNTGGNGDGLGWILEGSTLEFRFQDNSTAAQRVFLAFDLSSIGSATDFYHVVGTADVDSAASGTGQFFVNGNLVVGPTTSTGTINDWDGGDAAGLGGVNFNIPGTTGYVATTFTGSIAAFNWYGGELLTAGEVTTAYNALIPEPSAALLALLGCGLALRRWR